MVVVVRVVQKRKNAAIRVDDVARTKTPSMTTGMIKTISKTGSPRRGRFRRQLYDWKKIDAEREFAEKYNRFLLDPPTLPQGGAKLETPLLVSRRIA
ncbi:MAG: hypothetical protein P4M11_03165 [Candidatus Pacebacteria bacterium]|nr:hypothetical protein [Candidatus Paceibacterota bacterium]